MSLDRLTLIARLVAAGAAVGTTACLLHVVVSFAEPQRTELNAAAAARAVARGQANRTVAASPGGAASVVASR